MDLLTVAETLLEKVKAYVEISSEHGDSFCLREDIRAAASQIPCLLDGPEQAMHTVARQYTVCTALKICTDLELASKLQSGKSVSLRHLADATNCDYRILRPVLRVLAQHGIFGQTKDGSWQHTPMSNVINHAPFRAWMNSILEEKYQSTAHLPAFLLQGAYKMPSTGNSAYNAIYQTPLDFYTYVNEEDHAASSNFAVSMRELARTQLPFIDACYAFDKLNAGTRFVDIASGEGNLSFYLAEKMPHATFELQDHATVIAQARSCCNPAWSDRISFTVHDMFEPQPQIERQTYNRGVVYMLKIILHDHDDVQCRLILGNIISAMTREDRLLIMETVLPEAGGGLSSSLSDMIILSMFGCGHRTLKEWMSLIEGSGRVWVKTYGGGAREFDGMMVFEVRLDK